MAPGFAETIINACKAVLCARTTYGKSKNMHSNDAHDQYVLWKACQNVVSYLLARLLHPVQQLAVMRALSLILHVLQFQ